MRIHKKEGAIPLLVLLALVGCEDDSTVTAQRDVYTRLEDCMADWGDKALCQQMEQTAEAEAQRAANTGAHGGVVMQPYPYFYGPTYYGGERVVYVGDQHQPRHALGNHSAQPPRITTVRSSSLPSHVSRGGFGRTGGSFGAGS